MLPPLPCNRQPSDEMREGGLLPSLPSSSLVQHLPRMVPAGPLKVIFLDIDGVLAPRTNAGQIVHQCVDAVVALCRCTGARIVLSSSWRLLDGKVEMLDTLLKDEHGGDGIYDVTPDLRLEQDDGGATLQSVLHQQCMVRVTDHRGIDYEDCLKALSALKHDDEASRRIIFDTFSDPDYDQHVFSEASGAYSRECFSPRSRAGTDWTHEPCTTSFARTRCCEIALWLEQAREEGADVSDYAVLDDDDLLQTGRAHAPPVNRVSSRLSAPSTPKVRPIASGAQPLPGEGPSEGDDDHWMFAF